MVRRVRDILGPRPGLLAGFAALVVLIVAAFAFVVADSESTWSDAQARARDEAAARFATEASISAQLTSSIFTASSTASQTAAARAFSGPTVSTAALDAVAKRSNLDYVAILGGDGKLMGASTGAPASLATASVKPSLEIRSAMAGKPALSDLQAPKTGKGGPVIVWALPFTTPSGRRIQVQGFKASTLFGFLSGYLVSGKPNAGAALHPRPQQPRRGGDPRLRDAQARCAAAHEGPARPHGDRGLGALPQRERRFALLHLVAGRGIELAPGAQRALRDACSPRPRARATGCSSPCSPRFAAAGVASVVPAAPRAHQRRSPRRSSTASSR